MFCQEALTPNIYPCVISFEGGESLAIFYFALSMLELEEDFDDMKHPVVDGPKSKPYPSDITACEPKRGESLANFYFAFFNFELRG
jgi:hypothetical protein